MQGLEGLQMAREHREMLLREAEMRRLPSRLREIQKRENPRPQGRFRKALLTLKAKHHSPSLGQSR